MSISAERRGGLSHHVVRAGSDQLPRNGVRPRVDPSEQPNPFGADQMVTLRERTLQFDAPQLFVSQPFGMGQAKRDSGSIAPSARKM
jgi:hypothetical protein